MHPGSNSGGERDLAVLMFVEPFCSQKDEVGSFDCLSGNRILDIVTKTVITRTTATRHEIIRMMDTTIPSLCSDTLTVFAAQQSEDCFRIQFVWDLLVTKFSMLRRPDPAGSPEKSLPRTTLALSGKPL